MVENLGNLTSSDWRRKDNEMFEQKIFVRPAYDKRGETPNYGRHNAEIMFCLRDTEKKAAVVLLMSTGWEVPSSRKDGGNEWSPSGTISWHSSFWNSKDEPDGECAWLDGSPCAMREVYRSAEDVIELLVAEGSDAMWKKLEELYVEKFGRPRKMVKGGH